MHLSTTVGIVKADYAHAPRESYDRCFSLLKAAGYDRVDIDFWSASEPDGYLASETWEETVAEIAELSRKHGLPIHQTHCNTYSAGQWDDPSYPYRELHHLTNLRSIKGTAILGGKWTVMHPVNLPHDALYDPKKAKDTAIRQLEPYIEEAKKLGVGIAVENMVDFRGHRRRFCGGDIYELIDLVDTINDPSVGICFDTGHANIGSVDTAAAIREIGSRLKATHINDNHAGDSDEHLFPYFGNVNWSNTVKALKDIGYDGDFNYEAGSQKIPPQLYPDWLVYTAKLGRYLISLT